MLMRILRRVLGRPMLGPRQCVGEGAGKNAGEGAGKDVRQGWGQGGCLGGCSHMKQFNITETKKISKNYFQKNKNAYGNWRRIGSRTMGT